MASGPRTGKGLFDKPARALRPLNKQDALSALAQVAEAAEEAGEAVLAASLRKSGGETAFLEAVFELSPFLRDAARRRPEILARALGQDAEERLAEILAEIAAAGQAEGATEASVMKALRLAKGEAHFLIALADLSGQADVPLSVRRLSALAEACTGAAVGFLLREAHAKGKLRLPDLARPSEGSGLIVLGMGKLGGEELNFSSDIDLVVFFDPRAPAVPDPMAAAEFWARLTRRLVRILQDRTEHGYVFRTDLRLRPDPGSTPLALAVEAALTYYEGRGQNWERAAMIKGRPVAGDRAAGEAFLRELRPFVWRRYLDYAAIADIHSIKRQIHAHKGFGAVSVPGHNVKLGRGGIREVEFFVQTQQLIAGGRYPNLRGRRTVPMLGELARQGWIGGGVADGLARCYWFLRRVEHALQVIADEQTHTLPEDGDGLERVARLLGLSAREPFEAELTTVLSEVERQYAALFENQPALSGRPGNLVFTGTADDPGTLQTLAALGFSRPSDMAAVIRSWHFGRYRATQSAEARERLTELTPALLQSFSETGRADQALLNFDAFLRGLPAGIQLFSLLQSNRRLLDLLSLILGAAPRLAAIITRRPHVFDGLLDPALFSDMPDRAALAGRLAAFLEATRHFEEVLDRLRIFVAEQKFGIGVRLLLGVLDARQAGEAFSDLADLAIIRALHEVRREMEERHGLVPGGRVAVLGLGRLGSRELTAGSDVDLILLYEHDEDAPQSDGAKPLAPSQYFARLTQRLVAAVSAPTAEGVLYAIDLRLRPSGNKGPVATRLSAFRRYQRNEAWTWEHMALARARTVAGDGEFCAEVAREVAAVVGMPRDRNKLFADAAEMRGLLAREKPPRDPWDLKFVRGGIIDLEFIAQCAVLAGKVAAGTGTATASVLAALDPSFGAGERQVDLLAAYWLFNTITQLTRLCLEERFEPGEAPPGLIDLLLSVTGSPDIEVLGAQLVETERAAATSFEQLIAARALDAAETPNHP